MIAWLIANPLARKIAIYALIVIACLYALRLWGNAQWAKGEAKGRMNVASHIEKQKRDEWKAKEAAIASGAAILASEKAAINDARAQLSKDRAELGRSLERSLAQIRQERMRQYESVAAIPDPLLDSAIRAISRELAGASQP